MSDRLITVVETPEYLRRARAVGMTDEDRAALVSLLAAAPAAGVALGGGLYKMRLARPGSGKSGGWRILHFFRSEATPVFLLSVFGKNERANISAAERAELTAICDLIAATYGRRT